MESDNSLVLCSRDGDQAAFGELVDRHMQAVYAFAYRYVREVHDAEDVAQEAFFRAWKHLNDFDTTKNFKTWIFVIAKNLALDILKRKAPAPFSRLGETNEALDSFLAAHAEGEGAEVAPDAATQAVLSREVLGAATAKLPASYRAVLAMRYRDELKFREIADLSGESINTVKSKHHRAIVLLRKLLSA